MMIRWNKYKGHDKNILGKRKKYDGNIYSLDIETSSWIILDGKILPAVKYLDLSEDDRKRCEKHGNMYIWMVGINDTVYYGRTWDELRRFLLVLSDYVPELKYLYIHNQSFEFQCMRKEFNFTEVMARKARHVMTSIIEEFNFNVRCTYLISNCGLKYLPEIYNLPVEKQVGDLDYSLIRHSKTPLTEKELGYCEYDILVMYYYIKKEIETYEDVKHIPTTNTGKVRHELQDLVRTDFKYKRLVSKSINTNPIVYNRLVEAFQGGYTHSNYAYTSEILENVDSFDETSAYPYCMTTHKFPSSDFRKCYVKKVDEMSKRLAYLLVVKFTNIKCKYLNNFISSSKCRNIRGARYDNGRIISASELEITLTDIDFYFILDTHKCEYEILESYVATYNYLPKQLIEFILDKYVKKTEYKNVPGKEIEYQIEKGKFNSIYGMTVTNTIRSEVIYDSDNKEWDEDRPLTNDEILEKLLIEKKKGFLSFSTGCWVTAYARDNLLRRVVELDDYVCYCDTDSCKVVPGYNKDVFIKYNESVRERIKLVSSVLKIPMERYEPTDVQGEKHMLGLFEDDGHYEEFITQGAKKYAYTKWKKNGKVKESDNVIEVNEDTSKILEITVAGVPKSGSNAMKSLNDFKDDFIFEYKYTNKNIIYYVDSQEPILLTDYLGNEYMITDKTACCLLPTTYVLCKSIEYSTLIDSSSDRAIYREE